MPTAPPELGGEVSPLLRPKVSRKFHGFAKQYTYEFLESFYASARDRAGGGVGSAAFLIRDAVLGPLEDPAEGAYNPYTHHGLRPVISVICRRLCAARVVRFLSLAAVWMLVLVSFLEPPNWCRTASCNVVLSMRGPAADEPTLVVEYYPNSSTLMLTEYQASMLDLGCWTVLVIRILLQIGHDGMSPQRYFRPGPARWLRTLEVVVVSLLGYYVLSVITYQNSSSARVLAPFLRISVLFAFCRECQREFATSLKFLPEVLWLLLLLLLWLVFFSWIGVVAFYGSDQGDQHFPNLVEAMWTMWQMTTTVNYPDVMMPAYNKIRGSAWFFIIYMVVTFFFLMNLLLASIVNAHDNELEFRAKEQKAFCKSNLKEAYRRMDTQGEGKINRETVMALFLILNEDFPEIRKVPDEECRILFAILDKDGDQLITEEEFMSFGVILLLKFEKESTYVTFIETVFPVVYKSVSYQRFCAIIRSTYFEGVIDIILVLNAVIVGIQSWPMLMGQTVDIDPHLKDGEIDTVWEKFQSIFTCIYFVEVVVKVLVFGWKRYSESGKNMFDFCITGLSIGTTIYVYYPNDFSNSILIRLVVMARVFRLGRLLAALRPFQVLAKISMDIFPKARNVLLLLFIIMYIFAALGVQLFGGWITRDPSNPKSSLLLGTDFAAAAYWANNFNDMISGMNVLFNLLVINNWQVCSDGFEAVAQNLCTRFYFLAFHICGIILVNNLVIAFIINAFIHEWDVFHEITDKKEVHGEAVIHNRRAAFDASEVTGTPTDLTGKYVVRIEGGDMSSEHQQFMLKSMFTRSDSSVPSSVMENHVAVSSSTI